MLCFLSATTSPSSFNSGFSEFPTLAAGHHSCLQTGPASSGELTTVSVFGFLTISLNSYKLCNVSASQISNKGKAKQTKTKRERLPERWFSECSVYVSRKSRNWNRLYVQKAFGPNIPEYVSAFSFLLPHKTWSQTITELHGW